MENEQLNLYIVIPIIACIIVLFIICFIYGYYKKKDEEKINLLLNENDENF